MQQDLYLVYTLTVKIFTGLLIQEVEFPHRNNISRTHTVCDSDRKCSIIFMAKSGISKCLSSQPTLVVCADLPDKVRAPKAEVIQSDH